MSFSRHQFIFVALLALAFGVWTYEYFTRQTNLALVAIDDQHAITVVNGYFSPKIQKIDDDGSVVWSTAVPAIRETGVRAGLSVAGDTLTARVLDADDQVKTWGIDVHDGSVRWKGIDLNLRHPSALSPAYVSSIGDSNSVYEFETTDPVTVVAADRSTGTEQWRTPIPDAHFDVAPAVRAWLRPAAVIVDKPATLALIDRASGALTTLTARRWLCVTDNALYFEPENDSALHRRMFADGAQTDLGALEGHLTGQCADYQTKTFLLTEVDRAGRVEIVDGEERRAMAVAPWSLDPPDHREWRARYPERQPMRTGAARFVPVSAVDWHPQEPSQPADHAILMLDLENEAVAWTLVDARFQHGRWIEAGELNLFVLPGELAVFDGTTGTLRAAATVEGARPTLPEHVAGKTLWLYGVDEILQLDLRTLEPSRAAARIRIRPTTWPAPSDPAERGPSGAVGQQ